MMRVSQSCIHLMFSESITEQNVCPQSKRLRKRSDFYSLPCNMVMQVAGPKSHYMSIIMTFVTAKRT